MAGGHGGARRRSRAVTAIAGERDRGGDEDEGECEGVPGGGVELRATSRRGGGSQAGRRWPGRVAARATEQLRGEGEEDDRGRSGGGLGRLEELGQVGYQVSAR